MKLFIYLFIIFAPSSFLLAQQNNFKKTVSEQNTSQKEAAQSQKKIDRLDDETQKLLQEYRLTLKKIENTKKYNEQLRLFIKKQKEEMISLRKQIEQVKDTGKDVVPLMLRMLESLEQFISLDIPFLVEERKESLADLKSIMKRADVSISEKYRRILKSYEIESEYGRTISTYKGKQEVKGKSLTVQFLRVGRVALIYQTLNKKYSAYWDNNKKEWVKLSGSYKKSISKAIAIANKQLSPDLFKIPVPAPQERPSL